MANTIYIFLLTRPSRDATVAGIQCVDLFKISTHAPLTGRDHFP